MAQFDPKEYETEVVRPLRGSTGRLPDDLLTRYAVDTGMSDAELSARLDEVRSLWNKGVQSRTKPPYLRSVYKAFLRADEELKREHGDKLESTSWWRRHEAERAGSRGARVDELVRELGENFGELKLITSAQLDSYRSTFSELSHQEVDQALRSAQVRRAVPVELPPHSGMRQYDRFARLLREAQVVSVPQLLHGELTRFWLLDGFSAEPDAPGGLTSEAVRGAVKRAERRSGTRELREALGLLGTAVEQEGLDLRVLALYHLVADIRAYHANQAPTPLLLRRLDQAGLSKGEACQVVVGVLAEGEAVREGGLPRVRALLEQGLIIEAQQALGGIGDADEAGQAWHLVREQSDRVRELRESAEQELSGGSHEEARRQLRRAAAFAVDDEELAAQLHRIPPAPVREVQAHPEGPGVRLSWRSSPEHDEDVLYRVVRKQGALPVDADDGEVVAETERCREHDLEAPVGVLLGYGVFAMVGAGPCSGGAGTSVRIVPPIDNVQITASERSVEARWRAHPDVLDVEVVREEPGGRAVVPAEATSFSDTTADLEVVSAYVLTARYRLADGSIARAEETRVAGPDRRGADLPQVSGLDGHCRGGVLVLSWTWPAGVTLAEVDWSGSSSGSTRVSHREYRESGGCRIPAGDGAMRVRVRSVVSGRRTTRSEPTSIDVAASAPCIRYSLDRKFWPLVGGGTAHIRVVADTEVHCTLAVVVRQGEVMPEEPDQGRVLHREPCDLTAHEPVEFSVPVPRMSRPFWIRCFAEHTTARLQTPHTSDMKVS